MTLRQLIKTLPAGSNTVKILTPFLDPDYRKEMYEDLIDRIEFRRTLQMPAFMCHVLYYKLGIELHGYPVTCLSRNDLTLSPFPISLLLPELKRPLSRYAWCNAWFATYDYDSRITLLNKAILRVEQKIIKKANKNTNK